MYFAQYWAIIRRLSEVSITSRLQSLEKGFINRLDSLNLQFIPFFINVGAWQYERWNMLSILAIKFMCLLSILFIVLNFGNSLPWSNEAIDCAYQ